MIQQYSVNNYEYGILVEPIDGDKLIEAKVGIKKLMPMMTINDKHKKEYINKNLFVNASDCKISVSNTIELQNYITLSKYVSDDPIPMKDKTVTENGKKYIPSGEPIMIEVLYGDVKNMHLIRKG